MIDSNYKNEFLRISFHNIISNTKGSNVFRKKVNCSC